MTAARTLIQDKLLDSRVVLMGASGWFGREFLALMFPHVEVLSVASEDKQITVDGVTHSVIKYELNAIKRFQPDVVIDCAGLNRHYEHRQMFLDDCLNLTLNYLNVAALPSVKAGLTFSSGAATFDPLGNQFSLYSASKVLHERMVSQADIPTLIMRCYAVTGLHCQEPRGYAVTDFIEQAKEGKIKINSNTPTFRRYMAFEDYAATGIAELGKSAVIESGGYWTEIGQVAQIVARAYNVKVQRKKVTGKPQQYGAQDNVTHRIAQREGIKVKSIVEQVYELL